FPAMVVLIGALFVAAGGFWASWRQSNFNMEMREKNEEIARLQHENASLITGGDGFAYVGFRIFGLDGKAITAKDVPDELLLNPLINHPGQYPLYDVAVRFHEFREPVTGSVPPTYSIGNMTPGGKMTDIQLRHRGKDIKYTIHFSARNGLW